jgi:primase-polymerase (primpol)-like protein
MTSTAKVPAGQRGQSQVSGVGTRDYGSTDTGNQATAVTPESIPTALRPLRQWVAWKLEHREGKPTKVPYRERGRARSNSPQTGITASLAMTMYRNGAGHYAGVGFMLSTDDPFTVLDLDDCRDPETGTIEPWAQQVIDEMDSYTEPSPTGTGVHIWVRATKPGPRCRKDNIEIYEHSRFVTVTGQRLPGTPATIEPRHEQLNDLYSRVFPPDQPRNTAPTGVSNLDDQRVIELIRASKQGPKFDRLWSGDTGGHPSHSDADGSLTMMLAFWTNRDPAQMDRLVRRSGLYRDKWDEQRGAETYGERTIRTALEKTTEGYEPTGGNVDNVNDATINGGTVDNIQGFTADVVDNVHEVPRIKIDNIQLDPDSACTQRVTELERENLTLRTENHTLRTENLRLKDVENLYSLQWKAFANPDLSGNVKLIAAGTLYEIQSAPKHNVDEHGRTKIWRDTIARRTGTKVNTISNIVHGELAELGLFEIDIETVREERPDKCTGEIRMMPTKQWFARPTADIEDALERMAAYRKPEGYESRGGPRVTGCKDHPDAPVRVRTVSKHECSVCNKTLDIVRHPVKHLEPNAAPVDDDILVYEETSPDPLTPKVWTVEDTHPPVDSPSIPKVWMIEDEASEPPSEDDAESAPIQRRRQPYEGEIWNRYVHGGDDD